MHRKILIADDSVARQREMQQLLHQHGYEVLTVSDGDLAISKIHDFQPHIVMLDIIMPGKTGYEVCGYIKNESELNQIPVILTFSEDEPFDLAEARRVGATRCLPKTIDPDNLIAALNFICAGVTSIEYSEEIPYPVPTAEIEVEPIEDGESIEDDNSSQLYEVKLKETADKLKPVIATTANQNRDPYNHLFDTSIIKIQNSSNGEEETEDLLHVEEDLISNQCRDCGARVVMGDIFCVECGAALDEAVKYSTIGLNCGQCGQSISQGDVFCLNCGAVQ
jgi:twitching motility two-component system response regulator PilG